MSVFESYGNTGLCSLEISRTSKGDYTYTLKTYFSAKGRSPEAAIDRADRLRLEVEKRLGLRQEEEAGEQYKVKLNPCETEEEVEPDSSGDNGKTKAKVKPKT